MTSLNDEPAIISMANSLSLDPNHPADSIKAYCLGTVGKYLRRKRTVSNINGLQALICKRLHLAVHEIHADEDVKRYADTYFEKQEIGAAGHLLSQMRPDTFGVIVKLDAKTQSGRAQFVTFIDCRGEKVFRRVWTTWHEIVHCLTAKEQLELPLRRTTSDASIEKDPIERLTDELAGELAFYDPFFLPILEAECGNAKKLTFRIVENVRNRYNPDASWDSTLRACLSRMSTPLLLLEAEMILKKNEQRLVASKAAKFTDFPVCLRVARSFANVEGRQHKLYIPKQWRVPANSIINRVYSGKVTGLLGGSTAEENLNTWATSSGKVLPDMPIRVEAKRIGDRVIALIALAA